MATNQGILIAGSVIVGALLLRRFTTILGAEGEDEIPCCPECPEGAACAACHPDSVPCGTPIVEGNARIPENEGSVTSTNPCESITPFKDKVININTWEKKRIAKLNSQITSTKDEAKAERKGAKQDLANAKKDCTAQKEKDRKTGVTTATTTIKTKSQEEGFLAALTTWLATWGQNEGE